MIDWLVTYLSVSGDRIRVKTRTKRLSTLYVVFFARFPDAELILDIDIAP